LFGVGEELEIKTMEKGKSVQTYETVVRSYKLYVNCRQGLNVKLQAMKDLSACQRKEEDIIY